MPLPSARGAWAGLPAPPPRLRWRNNPAARRERLPRWCPLLPHQPTPRLRQADPAALAALPAWAVAPTAPAAVLAAFPAQARAAAAAAAAPAAPAAPAVVAAGVATWPVRRARETEGHRRWERLAHRSVAAAPLPGKMAGAAPPTIRAAAVAEGPTGATAWRTTAAGGALESASARTRWARVCTCTPVELRARHVGAWPAALAPVASQQLLPCRWGATNGRRCVGTPGVAAQGYAPASAAPATRRGRRRRAGRTWRPAWVALTHDAHHDRPLPSLATPASQALSTVHYHAARLQPQVPPLNSAQFSSVNREKSLRKPVGRVVLAVTPLGPSTRDSARPARPAVREGQRQPSRLCLW